MHNNPFDRNWIEVRILDYLNDKKHPVSLRDIRDTLVPSMQETVTCKIFDMRDEGLLNVFEPEGPIGKMVEITAVGKAVLFDIHTAHRHNCD